MITIHWSWVLFIVIVAVFVILIVRSRLDHARNPGGYINIDLITPFIAIAFIAFILIWGGVFWW